MELLKAWSLCQSSLTFHSVGVDTFPFFLILLNLSCYMELLNLSGFIWIVSLLILTVLYAKQNVEINIQYIFWTIIIYH